MFHFGTDGRQGDSRTELNRIVSPDAGFLAHLAGSLMRPAPSRRRAEPETATSIYGAVADRFGTPWPRATVSRSI